MSEIIQPFIIKETSEGFFSCRIEDEMLANRQVQCIGQINSESVNALIMQLLYLQRVDEKKEITMYINSPGGEVSSGLALYDVMKAIKCPIRTVCVGIAASMGAILFISGNNREILPHGRIMIHDPLIGGGLGGSALHIKSVSEDLMRVREIMGGIIATHTGRSIQEVYEKTACDSFFYAEEAVAYGLADTIITTI